MRAVEKPKGLTLRYTESFQCQEGDCSDTCCQHWNVPLEKSAYERLESLIPEEKFKQTVSLCDGTDQFHYARLEMEQDGGCAFLDRQDRLCAIHKSHGRDALGSVCKQYPRRYSIIGGREEMSMALSCPEAARLCLLGEGATEFVYLAEDKMVSEGDPIWHTQPETPDISYHGYMDVLREIFMQLASTDGLETKFRAYMALFLAESISEFAHHESESVDEDQLSQALALLGDKDAIVELHEQFSSVESDTDIAMAMIQGVLSATLSASPSFSAVMNTVLAAEGIQYQNGDFTAGDGDVDQAFARLAQCYQERDADLQSKYGERIDLYFKNYCRNFWFRELYIKSPTPIYHVMDMIVRMTVIRFALVMHPTVDALIADAGAANGVELLDKAAVDTFYRFSRGVEQGYDSLKQLYQALNEQGGVTKDNLVYLLRF